MSAAGEDPELDLVAVTDERDPLAERALALVHRTFAPADRQPVSELLSELKESRLGLLSNHNFHLIAAVAPDDEEPAGTIIGVYLGGVNAGLVMYLAVRREYRGHGLGRLLRPRLLEAFQEDARRAEHDDVAFVLGEVRAASPWLRRLVATRGAIPFDLEYYHPGMAPGYGEKYVLYRQPFGDARTELPVALVRRILYAIYRRAYRVRYPLQREGFVAMLRQLEGRSKVGMHPEFARRSGTD
ncbi:MAG TPA: GNAT family N-acetyltransferase [Longimicrobiales bacterium]|nr:GNAT family N-acetyltransferase [Longimicrobiales bacterium]